MDLSIIVPVYNVEKYLWRCLESIYQQKMDESHFEVIVINDGSTDDSLNIAMDFIHGHNNIQIISQQNKGSSCARNAGISYSRGKYVMFVDSDDYLVPNTIYNVLSIAIENHLDICSFRMNMLRPDGSEQEYMIQPFAADKILSGEKALLSKLSVGSACAALYNLNFIHKFNLSFAKGMTHEDVDFNIKAYAFAERVLFTDRVCYTYFWNDTSLNRSKSRDKVEKSIFDELVVAKNLKHLSKNSQFSIKLREFFTQYANSLIISTELSILRKKQFTLLKEFIKRAKSNELYPIKGNTLSWKTTILGKFINYFI